MNLNHRINFERENSKNNPKYDYICQMITFGLFTQGNYVNTMHLMIQIKLIQIRMTQINFF